MALLEAQAEQDAAEGRGAGAGGDLGKRSERGAAAAAREAAAREAAEQKRARFDAALEKANWASQFLRPEDKKGAGGKGAGVGVVGEDDDEGDRELRESLERARRLAQKKREEEEEARAREAGGDGEGGVKKEEGEGAEGSTGPVVKREGGSVEEVARMAAARRQAEGGKAGGAGGIGEWGPGPELGVAWMNGACLGNCVAEEGWLQGIQSTTSVTYQGHSLCCACPSRAP